MERQNQFAGNFRPPRPSTAGAPPAVWTLEIFKTPCSNPGAEGAEFIREHANELCAEHGAWGPHGCEEEKQC